MSDTHDCPGDCAAYVLGALDRAEAARFEQHLRSCTICQHEVESLTELTDSLALSVPQVSAPRRLRRAVMADVRADARTRAEATRHRRAPLRTWLATGATALALAAAAFGVVELQSSGTVTHIYPAKVGSAEVRVSGEQVELVVHGLHKLGPGSVYEVWLRRGDGSPQPTRALFEVSASGNGHVRVPGDFDHVDEVMVTKEPAGGSAVPTNNPVVVARIS